MADLPDDFSRLSRGEEGILKKKTQGIPLYKLFQDAPVPLHSSNLENFRQIEAGIAKQLLVDIGVSSKAPQNKTFARGPVPNVVNNSPGTFL